jgi:hypothetical protein
MVFKKLCYKGPYIGNIADVGDQVKIVGIGRPTIRDYTKGQDLTLEYLDDDSQVMYIDQAKYFDFAIDDIDAKQAAGEIKSAQLLEARRGLAETADSYIAGLYGSAYTTVTETEVTSANVISTLADAYTYLLKNNVPTNEEVIAVVPPDVAGKISMADIVFNTDNSATLAGYVGKLRRFMNLTVKMSNSLTATGNGFYCMMLTRKAIAFAEQIVKVEAFRPSDKFADAVKGLHVYGAKVIKPKDLVTMALTTAAETSI